MCRSMQDHLGGQIEEADPVIGKRSKRTRPWGNWQAFITILCLAFRADLSATLDALYCLVRGLRVRGWNRLCVTAMRHPDYYDGWTVITEPKLFEKLLPPSTQDNGFPVIGIILGHEDYSSAVKNTAQSLRLALGADAPLWADYSATTDTNLLTPEPRSSLVETLKVMTATYGLFWLLPMKSGDTVSPHLGTVLTHTLASNADKAILYWDEDVSIAGKRQHPWIKPEWDELLFLARDCLSGSCIIRSDVAISIAEVMPATSVSASSISQMLMRVVSSHKHISPHHIPLIMSHRSSQEGFVTQDEWRRMVSTFWHSPACVTEDVAPSPFISVAPPEPDQWPSVTIIIPTRDHADVLATCLSSLRKLAYRGETEIIIVDNGSETPEALDLLRTVKTSGWAQVINSPGPFNFSSLNNGAIDKARGEFLCLLNNDIEAVDGEWLSNMIVHALRPDTGAVGAQLLYPDGTVQHAGVVIGMGNAAGHVQKGVEPLAAEHFAWHGVTRTVSAVTAACLVVRRDYYMGVGKLDETAFAVAYNDVDLCLKLKAKGLRNIYVAEARLIHHESKSRGNDYSPEHFRRFQCELSWLHSRWQTEGFDDPHYSPLFSRASERCVLQF